MHFTACGILFITYSVTLVRSARTIHHLQHGESFTYQPAGSSKLQIYCYLGKPKYVMYLWQSVSMQVISNLDDYIHYDGSTPEEIQKLYEERKSSWSFNLFSWKQKHFKFDPFNQSCVGIESSSTYKVQLNVIRVDYWKILRLVIGILLFLSADKLSKNSVFYYVCGVSFGICASLLISIYFISKLFPRRSVMYGVAACGWTVGVYILQMLWENTRVILLHYQTYVAWYIFITGFISFLLCYRWGPVSNERTRNLIKWSLQCAGLISIFYSSEFQEASMGQIVVLLLIYNMPQSWISRSKTYWKRKFPPKTKLLTNDEYYQQGVRETSKALEDLRQYCSSPECNQWKTALKLKDVKRFASFIEGDSHLLDEEILEYETSIQNTDLTDDEELTDEEN